MRRLGHGLAALLLLVGSGCDEERPATDSGTPGEDSGISLMDAGGGDAGTDSGSTDPDSGTSTPSCGPEFDGDCDIRADIAFAADGTGAPACDMNRACLPGPPMGDRLTFACYAAGPGVDGAPCTPGVAGVCAEGYGCHESEEVCRRWCCTNADCDPGVNCLRFGNVNVGICTTGEGCDLTDPESCGGAATGEGCQPFGSEGETLCAPVGDSPEGTECEGGQCAAGMGCIGPTGGPSYCRAYCVVGADPTTCPENYTCTMLTSGTIGACLPNG